MCAKAKLEYRCLHQDLRFQLFQIWFVSCDLFSRRTLMQHDDDHKNIYTKGDVCDILILNSLGNKFVGLFAWLNFLQNPSTPQHQMCNHRTLTCSLLSLVLLPTKLIATHHPCDSWINLHGHTYHFNNEHHHFCSSFQSPLPHWTNFHQHASIHPSMIKEVEYLIPSMMRTPC